MTDNFNHECPNCKITIGRIEKWIDHVNITPKKYQSYDMLLEFVKMIAKESLGHGTQFQNDETLYWITTTATNLLKDFGDNG